MAINSSNISLELAHRLTDVVNAAWKSGEMLEKVTPTTASLLNYWFGEGFATNVRETSTRVSVRLSSTSSICTK